MERDGGTWSSRQMDTCLEAGWETAPLGPPAPGMLGLCSPPARCPSAQRDEWAKQALLLSFHFISQSRTPRPGEGSNVVK